MKLAIAQMVLGAIIVLIFCRAILAQAAEAVTSGWGFVVSYPTVIIPLLGLAVLGCSIAQYLKARG